MSEQIKTTTIDKLPEATNTKNFWIFGYKSDNSIGQRSVKFSFDKIVSLFGVVSEFGQSITSAISQKFFTDEMKKKADLSKTDGSKVLYTDKDGKLPAGILSLATNDSDGLLSKEHYKIIFDMEQNFDALINAVNELTGKPIKIIIKPSNVELQKYVDLLAFYGIGKGVVTTSIGTTGIANNANKLKYSDVLCPANGFINVQAEGYSRFTVNTDGIDTPLEYVIISDTSGMLKSISASSKRDSGVARIINNVDFKSCIALDTVSIAYTRGLKNLSAGNITHLYMTGCIHAEKISIETERITVLFVEDCYALTDISFIGDTLPKLKQLYVARASKIEANFFKVIAQKWIGRTPADNGVLRVSQAQYDIIDNETKTTLVNNNISIVII